MTPGQAAARVKTGIGVGAVLAAAMTLIGAPWPLPLDAGFLAHLSGMLAGYLTAVMLVLMSRAPWLENRVGSDVLARWHAKGGRLFLTLVLVHAIAATSAWASSRQVDLLSAAAAEASLPLLPAAVVGTVLFAVIAAVSIRDARRRVSYETWHLWHLLTYVGIGLVFLHEVAGPNLAGHPLVQTLWSLLHAYALALVLRFRLLRPMENAFRHRLRVAAVVPEADGVVSIIINGRHLDELGAQPGQFFRWRFLTPQLFRTAHPFSLSAPPHGDFLRITVKALGAGSQRLQTVPAGTRILAEGPSGAMTAWRRSRPSVLLIAGGIGITPMRALFETLSVGTGALTLIYRASRESDVVFRAELEQIASRRGGDIVWLIGPSADPTLQLTGPNLLRLIPDLPQRDVYLCASPRLASAARHGLHQARLPARQLHEEVFAF